MFLSDQGEVEKRRKITEGKAGENRLEFACWETQSSECHFTDVSG